MMNHVTCCKSLALTPCLLLLILLTAANARAQGGEDVPKLEVGVQFSSLAIRPPDLFGRGTPSASGPPAQVEPGFGGRVTYNFNSHFALEAEGNFFPHRNSPDFLTGGRLLQAQAGLKAGKRFGKFGLFAKARPGLVSFSEVVKVGPNEPSFFFLEVQRKTYFSMDAGGVVEFYPSRRIVTRFDAGDTMIRYGKFPSPFSFPGALPQVSPRTHNFQLSAGVGFRFFGPASSENKEDAGDAGPKKSARKFELGAQFTSLTFRTDFFFENFQGGPPSVTKITHTEPGFGARITYNLNDRLAVEAEGNFLPRKTDFVAAVRGSGRVTQGQFGVKMGKRFKSFGIFGKARPGFVSFGRMAEFLSPNPDSFTTSGSFIIRRKTYFSTDVGGVFEFYPSRRILTRFDAGDTMIRYDRQLVPAFNAPFTGTDHIPAQTSHNLQFSAGVGFRF
jgi:hypothetical protein